MPPVQFGTVSNCPVVAQGSFAGRRQATRKAVPCIDCNPAMRMLAW